MDPTKWTKDPFESAAPDTDAFCKGKSTIKVENNSQIIVNDDEVSISSVEDETGLKTFTG